MYLPDFFWKYRRPITLLVFLALSCLIMIDSMHNRWIAKTGNEMVVGLSSPIQKASESAYDGGRKAASSIPGFFTARAQNIVLKRRIGELEQEIVALREQMLQEQRIHELLELADETQYPRIIARVIGTNPTPWFKMITVDKGTSHGVVIPPPPEPSEMTERPPTVISSYGLVGYVKETNHWSSKVLLLTDSNSRVSVVVQRSRARGVVQGDNARGCVLKYVEPTADIKKGDILLTSGDSRLYPKGLLVGYVGELRNEPGNLFQWARVAPATNFEELEEVAIILTTREREATERGDVAEE